MTAHATHTMHANSMETWKKRSPHGRAAEVFVIFRDSVQPLTDRQVFSRLKSMDLSSVRARITGLIYSGHLAEVGKIKDPDTGATVRVCTNTRMDL